MDVIAQHLTKPLEPPYEHKRGLPATVSSIICKMMAKSPQDRYASYEQLREDLDRLLEGKEVKVVDFEDTGLNDEEGEELARMLMQLGSGQLVDITDEEGKEPQVELTDGGQATDSKGSSSNIDLFAPDELTAPAPAPEPTGDTTTLHESTRKPARKSARRVNWTVIVAAIVGIICLVGLVIGLIVRSR
jgi:hypothetical protein